jgi:hypothetical protein
MFDVLRRVGGWRRKGRRYFKNLNFLCIGRDTVLIMSSLQNILVTKYVVALMLTRLQGWHPLWCNALRRESKGCSCLLIGLITSLSAIIYRVQWHLAALISVTSALANACRLLSQILTPDYVMYILFSLSLMVTRESSNITYNTNLYTFYVVLTVHRR